MPSKKTAVIEWIFFHRKYDRATRFLRDPIVTFEDISAGIEAAGNGLSAQNPANFWKDLTRGDMNESWPKAVFEAGYTGSDAIGEAPGACFQFAPILDGQEVPFIDTLKYEESAVPVHLLQSLSMPVAKKTLGRRDENWLAQVSADLHVVETYFSIFSTRPVLEIAFLQTGIKLRKGEVDAAYSVTDEAGAWLLSVEAKGKYDPIHLPQIQRAAIGLAETAQATLGAVGVIPFALKIVGPSKIFCVEFEPLADANSPMVVASQGVIQLSPHVQGVE